jgi:hypothetical protein
LLVEPALEQNNAVDPTTQVPVQEIGNVHGDFDMIWESLASSTWDWDDIMEKFSMAPLYQ